MSARVVEMFHLNGSLFSKCLFITLKAKPEARPGENGPELCLTVQLIVNGVCEKCPVYLRRVTRPKSPARDAKFRHNKIFKITREREQTRVFEKPSSEFDEIFLKRAIKSVLFIGMTFLFCRRSDFEMYNSNYAYSNAYNRLRLCIP